MRYRKRLLILLSLIAFTLTVASVLWRYSEEIFSYEMPQGPVHFADLKPASAAAVIDTKGRVLKYIYGDRLFLYRPLGEISKHLVDFVVMLEDSKFYMHQGFDVAEIKNSFEKNLEKGKVKRGASTITQQLAKNLFLDKDRSFIRKFFEVPWTIRLEKDLSKKQILELYLNVIEWGPGIHGAEAASRHFFDRSSSELTLGQAMYLALIIPNPVRFDVFAHPKMRRFLESKKEHLVDRLVSEKKISESQRDEYLNADFGLVAPDSSERKYTPSHEGKYAGNRWQRDPVMGWLDKNFDEIKAGHNLKKTLQLTVDGALMRSLAACPDDSGDAPSDRYYVIQESGKIRAFRFVRKNHVLLIDKINPELTADFHVEESKEISWKSLAL